MRFFAVKNTNIDFKHVIWHIIVIIVAIISGIVLFTLSKISNYMYNFADNYVYNIFLFNNWPLFISHFLGELFTLYLTFAVTYFSKIKLLALPITFIKSFFTVVYAAILLSYFAVDGIVVTLLILIPSFFVSLCGVFFIGEFIHSVKLPINFFVPAFISLFDSAFFMAFINISFRLVVVLV